MMLRGGHTDQATLRNEIQHLQEQLQDQFVAREMLEKALNQNHYACDSQPANPVPKQAEEMIKEIAVLEREVAYLEKYVLSLYRKTFVNRVPKDNDSASAATINEEEFRLPHSCPILPQDPITSPRKERDVILSALSQSDSGTHRSQSSVSIRTSSHSSRIFPPMKHLTECDSTYHSLPLSMLERAEEGSRSNMISLGEHLLQSVPDHDWETPNWISEEMIKSISGIFCELAEPPLTANHPIPYMTSSSSPGPTQNPVPDSFGFSTFNLNLYNPSSVHHCSEHEELQTDVVEVRWISPNSEKLKDIQYMLRRYRSLVHRLREVDPSKLKHEEKLAFWINVHNSLGMHAFLVHGIQHTKLKRAASLLKAAYTVGGHTISLHFLRSSILHCKLPLPAQWIQLFFPSRRNSRVKDVPRAYAVDNPEHLLPFALSSGSYSDPPIRVYKPEKVFAELKAAREAYLRSNISLHRDKVLVPKLVQNYAKQSGLSPEDLLRIIFHQTTLPDSSTLVRQHHQKHKKASKFIEWIPHDFSFRYLLLDELS